MWQVGKFCELSIFMNDEQNNSSFKLFALVNSLTRLLKSQQLADDYFAITALAVDGETWNPKDWWVTKWWLKRKNEKNFTYFNFKQVK